MRYPIVLVSLLVAGCSPTTPSPDTTAPSPNTSAPGPDTTGATSPSPDTTAPSTANAYLVWWHTEKGAVTSWVGPDGVESTRAQIALFADDTLWGLEERFVPFTETDCDDFENDRKIKGGKRWLPYLVARGLDGRKAQDTLDLTDMKSGYFSEEKSADVFEQIGEHWGRTLSVVGGWRGLVLVNDCEGAYSCGAHGNTSCEARQVKLGTDAPTIALAQIDQQLAPVKQELLKTWEAEDEAVQPALDHLGIRSKRGEVEIDYVFVAEVPYVGTDGSWSSYTQSRTHTGAPLDALELGALPDAVKAALAKAEIDGHFGWSEVPAAHTETARRAFDDPSTLPAAAPADEPAPVGEKPVSVETKRLVEKGRRLTRDKRYSDAISAFDKAIADQPKHARAWSGRAYAKLLGGDLAGAKADCEYALTLEDAPRFQSSVFFNLGEIAEKQNDKSQARAHYQKALALSPSAAAQKRLDALDQP